MTIAAIPTTYRANAMRSRLEARWAVFFDAVGWRWTYEPLDADGYIPDFLIHGDRPFFVEVGPCIAIGDYQAKSVKPDEAAASLGHDLLIVGVTPIPDLKSQGMSSGASAGWFGEYAEWADDGMADPLVLVPGFSWSSGQWAICSVCRRLAVYHDIQSYTARPCGHYDGGANLLDVDPGTLDNLWARAGSGVQWKPR